jgi:hypothetical protein
VPRKALEGYIEEKRSVGRPRERCLDGVGMDVKMVLKCINWRRSAENRVVWRQRMDKTKAQVGLQRHGRRR